MTVEVAATIAGLNETLPLATDPKSEGDDHIRLIKAVLKTNLNNVNNTSDENKPVSTATQTALDLKANASDVTTSLEGKANLSGATFTGNVAAPRFNASTGVAISGDTTDFSTGSGSVPNYGIGYLTGTSETVISGFGGVRIYTGQTLRASWDGSGNATFSGVVAAPEITLSSTYPVLNLRDSDATDGNKNARISYSSGSLVFERINDALNAVTSAPFQIDAGGNATFSGNLAIQGAGLSQNGVNLPVGVTAGMTMTSATSHLAGNASVLRMAIADGSSPAGVSVHNIHDGTYSSQEVAISTSVGGIEPTTERLRFYKDGKILATNSPGLGYGAGSGGTATQPTSKSTAVLLSKPSGQITMHNAALAAGVEVEFIVNCSVIAASDSVLVNVSGGVLSFTNYRLKASIQGAGQFVVGIENRTGGSLSEAVVINFNVIKGSTT